MTHVSRGRARPLCPKSGHCPSGPMSSLSLRGVKSRVPRESNLIGGTVPRRTRDCRSFVTPDFDPGSSLSRVPRDWWDRHPACLLRTGKMPIPTAGRPSHWRFFRCARNGLRGESLRPAQLNSIPIIVFLLFFPNPSPRYLPFWAPSSCHQIGTHATDRKIVQHITCAVAGES